MATKTPLEKLLKFGIELQAFTLYLEEMDKLLKEDYPQYRIHHKTPLTRSEDLLENLFLSLNPEYRPNLNLEQIQIDLQDVLIHLKEKEVEGE